MTTAPKTNQPIEDEFEETESMKIAQFESAIETMMAYVGYLTNQVLEEEDLPNPNQLKIRALEQQIDTVMKERKAILPEDEMLIAKARFVYGPIMKAIYMNA